MTSTEADESTAPTTTITTTGDGEGVEVEDSTVDPPQFITLNINPPSSSLFNTPTPTPTSPLPAIKISVNLTESLFDVRQYISDIIETAHITSYNLVYNETVLSNYLEIQQIPEIVDGATLTMQPCQYDELSVRAHIQRFNELLNNPPLTGLQSTVKSESTIESSTEDDHRKDPEFIKEVVKLETLLSSMVVDGKRYERVLTENDVINCCIGEEDLQVPSTAPPNTTPPAVSILQLHQGNDPPCASLSAYQRLPTTPFIKCIKRLSISGWAPVPSYRRLVGDLTYLSIHVMDDVVLSVTASIYGYFINKCSEERFDPSPASPSHLSHDLLILLMKSNSHFKKNYNLLLEQAHTIHNLSLCPIPFPAHQWLTPAKPHSFDGCRVDMFGQALYGAEAGLQREWNEEFQITRSLPKTTLQQRIIRERSLVKLYADFCAAAMAVVKAIVHRAIAPINPTESPSSWVYLYNNIFFSYAVDSRQFYEGVGGSVAAHASATKELYNVKSIDDLDLPGIHTLATCVMDYAGRRILAQSVVPGLLQGEGTAAHVYGSVNRGKVIHYDSRAHDYLRQLGYHLCISDGCVMDGQGEMFKLCGAVDWKVIKGTDGRYYLLDIIRTTPIDCNCVPQEMIDAEMKDEAPTVDGDKKNRDSNDVTDGFPLREFNIMNVLRSELIQLYFKHINKSLTEDGVSGASNDGTASSEDSLNINVFSGTICVAPVVDDVAATLTNEIQEIVMEDNKNLLKMIVEYESNQLPSPPQYQPIVDALTNDNIVITKSTVIDDTFLESLSPSTIATVSSLSSSNPSNPRANMSSISKARHLNLSLASFLKQDAIPSLVTELESGNAVETQLVSEVFHQHGVNMRYLGRVATLLSAAKPVVYYTILQEIVTRACKTIVRQHLSQLSGDFSAYYIVHFFNSILQSGPFTVTRNSVDRNIIQTASVVDLLPSQYTKVYKHGDSNMSLFQLTGKQLWTQIYNYILKKYNYNVNDMTMEIAKISRCSLLSGLCKTMGITIGCRDFSHLYSDSVSIQGVVDGREKDSSILHISDILDIQPLLKHNCRRNYDEKTLLEIGNTLLQNGKFEEATLYYNDGLNICLQIYGALHPSTVMFYEMFAVIYQLLNNSKKYFDTILKIYIINYNICGMDHPLTIRSLYMLAAAVEMYDEWLILRRKDKLKLLKNNKIMNPKMNKKNNISIVEEEDVPVSYASYLYNISINLTLSVNPHNYLLLYHYYLKLAQHTANAVLEEQHLSTKIETTNGNLQQLAALKHQLIGRYRDLEASKPATKDTAQSMEQSSLPPSSTNDSDIVVMDKEKSNPPKEHITDGMTTTSSASSTSSKIDEDLLAVEESLRAVLNAEHAVTNEMETYKKQSSLLSRSQPLEKHRQQQLLIKSLFYLKLSYKYNVLLHQANHPSSIDIHRLFVHIYVALNSDRYYRVAINHQKRICTIVSDQYGANRYKSQQEQEILQALKLRTIDFLKSKKEIMLSVEHKTKQLEMLQEQNKAPMKISKIRGVRK